MLPIAPLMIEHRLIEKMIAMVRQRAAAMEASGTADVRFIDAAVDFIRTYADACHHGKEEDILFRDLDPKPMSDEHRRIMGELLEEHRFGRKTVAGLVEARRRYAGGDTGVLPDIVGHLRTLADFYPKHIEKEDQHFFLPVMKYFKPEEQDRMLAEENEFDRRFVHEHYAAVVTEWAESPEAA